MSTKNAQVRTSILAKIALSKLESDIKACWDHLSNPESLKSKESLESADKIVKNIQRKASKLSEVIIDSEDWEKLVEPSEVDSEDPLMSTTPKSEDNDSEEQSLFDSFSELSTGPPKPSPKEMIFSHAFNWVNEMKLEKNPQIFSTKRTNRVPIILFVLLQIFFLVKIQNQGSQISTLRNDFYTFRSNVQSFDTNIESTVLRLKNIIGSVDDKVHWLKNKFLLERQQAKNKILDMEHKVFFLDIRVKAVVKSVEVLKKMFQPEKVEKKQKIEKIENNQNEENNKKLTVLEKFRKLAQLPQKIQKVLNDLRERRVNPILDGELRGAKASITIPSKDQIEPKMADKGVYFGEWNQLNNQFDGFGLLYSPMDKTYYEGYFLNGEKDGLGRMISEDGEVQQGLWKNGKFHKPEQLKSPYLLQSK